MGDVLRVDLQVQRLVVHEGEHQSVAKYAVAPEHAAHLDRPDGSEKIGNVLGEFSHHSWHA
jgi:hypothetical protein